LADFFDNIRDNDNNSKIKIYSKNANINKNNGFINDGRHDVPPPL